jgi:hypothetical protein
VLVRSVEPHSVLSDIQFGLGLCNLARLIRQVLVEYARLHGPGWTGDSTAARAYRLLRAMMRTAVADEMIAPNPCVVERGGAEHSPEHASSQSRKQAPLPTPLLPGSGCLSSSQRRAAGDGESSWLCAGRTSTCSTRPSEPSGL